MVLGAGLACLVRASSYGRERAAWTLIGLAILSWGAAEVYWTVAIDGNASAPYPSPADIGYLAFYPLAYAGLAVLVRARADQLNWRLWMDGAIAGLGTAAIGAAFVFDFVAGSTEGTPLQVATTLAYPLGDILMVAMVVGVIALDRLAPRPDLVAAPRRASPRSSSPTSPTPCRRPRKRFRSAAGSTRST